MAPMEWTPELRSSLERIARALAEMSSMPNLQPFLAAQEQMSQGLAAQMHQITQALDHSLRPLREALARVTAGIDISRFALMDMGINRAAEALIALGEIPRFDLPVARIPRIEMRVPAVFREMDAQFKEIGRRIAESAQLMMDREAKLRGITPEEFAEAFRSSAEFLEGNELETYQAVVAWNLYGLGEISFVRLFRALPPKARPLPAERSGIADDDFQPLVSGILWDKHDGD